MSDDIKEKIDQYLKNIELEKRCNLNTLLTEDDLDKTFDVLIHNDIETKPLLNIIHNFLKYNLKENYVLVESEFVNILKYYNIISGVKLLESRHQLFFNKNKIIKKQYFKEDKLIVIKEELSHILDKLKGYEC